MDPCWQKHYDGHGAVPGIYLMSLYTLLIQSLEVGWQRVLTNSEMAGIDGITVPIFGLDLDNHIDRLREELLSRTYRPLPLLAFDIPKPTGGTRRLAVPVVRDRLVQAAALHVLQPIIEKEMESISYAYRPGRSYQDAIEQIGLLRDEGFSHVVDADIHAYFDEVNHELLVTRLSEVIPDKDVVDLVRKWIMVDMVYKGRKVKRKKGLPQGSVISPLLANLYLDDLDEALLKEGYKLIRFADDFVVLCKSSKRAQQAVELTDQLLEDLHLRLNKDKTSVVTFEEGFKFLGSLFIRSLIIPSKTDSRSTRVIPEGIDVVDAFTPEPLTPEKVSTDSGAIGAALFEALDKKGITLGQFVTALESTPSPVQKEESAEGSIGVKKEPAKTAPAYESSEIDDLDPDDATLAFRRTLYIQEQGSWLRYVRKRFVVTDGKNYNEVLLRVPAARVDQIMIFGHCLITPAAMQCCLKDRIPVTLLSSRGDYYGQIESTARESVSRLRLQILHSLDEPRRRKVAIQMVRGKLYNLRSLLRRYARRLEDEQLIKASQDISRIMRRLEGAESLDQVRGFEGSASAIYFGVFNRLIKDSGFTFEGRNRRPPRDPVNAMLSFGYTLLFYNVYAAIRLHRMTPYVGMLHAERAGHAALASDLVEEFRFVIDRLVIAACNRGKFTASDFEKIDGGGCYFTADARKRYLKHFEAMMKKPIYARHSDKTKGFRQAIDVQVRKYAAYLEGGELYKPIRVI